jgi:hypothetical protein
MNHGNEGQFSACLAAVVAAASVAACVDTDTPRVSSEIVCISASPAVVDPNAVVKVRAALQPAVVRCSGVSVAPTLVVTSLGCVTRPSVAGDPDQLAEVSRAAPTIIPGSVNYQEVCTRGAAWIPMEDGSFAGRLGKPVDPSNVIVYARDDGRAYTVKAIATSGATSQCEGGLAVIILNRPLDVTPLSIRFEENSRIDDRVMLSGYCSSDGDVRPRTLDSRIEAIALGLASDLSPARTLSLAQEVSSFDLGGAVVARETGALLGVIANGTDRDCEELSENGTTVAVRLAPFRRMLLEAAQEAGEELQVEARPNIGDELRTCGARAAARDAGSP